MGWGGICLCRQTCGSQQRHQQQQQREKSYLLVAVLALVLHDAAKLWNSLCQQETLRLPQSNASPNRTIPRPSNPGKICYFRHRIEKEKGQEERSIAAAAEKKRQAKLRRARDRENRKKAASLRARHDEEMARIERWARKTTPPTTIWFHLCRERVTVMSPHSLATLTISWVVLLDRRSNDVQRRS